MSGEGVAFGEFQLLRRLGAGGMAEVFLARRVGPQGFEKQLVVKRLLPHLARSERFTQMLLREARYAALIDHPNFVHVSGFGVIDDGYYLAMEYVDGLTIEDLLGIVGSLSPGVAARIAIDLLDALHAIHTAKFLDGRDLHLVHRDITPGNVMITASGTVKVLDLGIAVPSNEIAPVRAGTRRYMSPEQSRGESLDARSDLYCVGLLLCLMLSGRHPFVADDLVSTLTRAPPVMRDVIMGLMQEDREERPSSAREVQARLEEFAVTQGREGTRAFLSELADEVAGEEPPPKRPAENTASCLLSFAVPDFDGDEAPTHADLVMHPFAAHPEPPTADGDDTGETPFALGHVEPTRAPGFEDVIETIELHGTEARVDLPVAVWPRSGGDPDESKDRLLGDVLLHPNSEVELNGPEARPAGAKGHDDERRPRSIMDLTGPDHEVVGDASVGDAWALSVPMVEPLAHEASENLPPTVVPTVVESLAETAAVDGAAPPTDPRGPRRADATPPMPWRDVVDTAELEDSKKEQGVRPRTALRLSLVVAALLLVAAWAVWWTSGS